MATSIDTVPSFPQAPQRTDTPENFVTLADAWVAFMDTFTDSLNTSIGQMNTVADQVEADAASAADSESVSASNANFVGRYADQTGAANVPYSVSHLGDNWQLEEDLADVTLEVPGTSAKWTKIFNLSRAQATAIALWF